MRFDLELRFVLGLFIAVIASSCLAQPLSEDEKYTLGDLGGPYDRFGGQLVLTDEFLITSSEDYSDGDAGEIWVYDRVTHSAVYHLLPPARYNAGAFGIQLSVHGNVLVTTSFDRDTNGSRQVIIYVYDLHTGMLVADFVSPNNNGNTGYNTRLLKIATNGHQLAVLGRDSRGYTVFVYDLATGDELWTFHEHIDSPAGDSAELTGPILMNDDLLIVAMPGDDSNSLRRGLVFVYDLQSGDTVYTLAPSDMNSEGIFGVAMAMQGDDLLVSAPEANAPTTPDSIGVVYLFNLSTGDERFKISQPEWDTSWRLERGFGHGVHLSDKYIIVGSPQANGVSTGTGLVYLFDRVTGEFIATLSASDGDLDDLFGYELAVYESEAFVTALGDEQDGNLSGSIYKYSSLPCTRADLADPRYELNDADVYSFLDLMVTQDLYADFNNDGALNFFDVSAFLTAFNAGCP